MIHWLIDEDHYKTELASTANSPLTGKNQKMFGVAGSYSLMNGAQEESDDLRFEECS